MVEGNTPNTRAYTQNTEVEKKRNVKKNTYKRNKVKKESPFCNHLDNNQLSKNQMAAKIKE